MTFLETRELYALFLGCDWWVSLSRRKRRLVGKCERCGSRKWLQAHHRVYRENWFDTTFDDLEVLCRRCHEEEHGISKPAPVVVVKHQEIEMASDYPVRILAALNLMRSRRQISHREYRKRRDLLVPEWRSKVRLLKRLRPKKEKRKRRKQRRAVPKPFTWYYNPTHRSRWVNRGSSGN